MNSKVDFDSNFYQETYQNIATSSTFFLHLDNLGAPIETTAISGIDIMCI